MYRICVACVNLNILFFIAQSEEEDNIIGISLQNEPIIVKVDHVLEEIYHTESLEEAFDYLSSALLAFDQTLSSTFPSLINELTLDKSKAISYKEVAIFLIKKPNLLEELAVYQKLLGEPQLFQYKGDGFFQLCNDEFKSLKEEQQKLYESLEEELEAIIELLLEKKRLSLTLQEQQKFGAILDPMKDWVIFQNESQYKTEAKKWCKYFSKQFPDLKRERNQEYNVFRFLNFIGVFHEYDNLLLKKYSVDDLFLNEDQYISDIIIEEHIDVFSSKPFVERKNLLDLYTISIDGDETLDYDDALSFIENEEGYEIYIHISDVASRISKDSQLDEMALQRVKTLYLPNQILHMFPQDMTYNTLALLAGQNNPTITYCIHLDKQFQFINYDVFEAMVCVDKNLSYKEVDDILNNSTHSKFDYFDKLFKASTILQKERIDNSKGIEFLFPQISPQMDLNNNSIYLKVYDTLNSKSTFIIKELMILTNYITALVCDEGQMNILFLNQEPPEQDIDYSNRYVKEKQEMMEHIKHMKRSYFDIENKGHHSLGLKFYTQATSPIRRYLDLVMQRQLKSLFYHKSQVYTHEDLFLMKNTVYLKQRSLQLVENETNKFFLLNFLLKYYINDIIYGVVIKSLSTREYLVELELTKNVVKVNSFSPVGVSSFVSIKLHTVIPRLGIGLGNIVECLTKK